MNFGQFAGHLGADPEVRFTSSGKKVTVVRLACKTRKAGKDDAIWWRVNIWGEEFDNMIPHLKKGSPLIVYGEILKPEIFNDREGKPQISMEIRAVSLHFSPFGRPDREGQGAPAAPGASHAAPTPPSSPYSRPAAAPMGASAPGETIDDEVPF